MTKNKNNLPPLVRVALYIRVSGEEQKIKGLSLEAQQERLEAYAREKGWIVTGVYIDAAKTARKNMHKRAEFQKMIESVKRDEVDLLLFCRLDRWFRSVADYYKVMEILQAHGCDWKTIDEEYDTTSANGRLYINVKLSMSGFEQMLSQEYDGQISLVVPNKGNIEKQITGQLNITDIMAEWERMKRENEEKRKEDVRKRVQQHTGNMFSEFDEATKTGLLEQLEKAVIEAILRESGEKEISPEDITEEKLTDLVKTVGKKKSENKGKAEEEIKEEITEEQDAETPEETETGKQETAESDSEEPKEESVPAADEVSGETDGKESVAAETGIIDLEKLLLETAGVETGKETKAEAAEGGKLRALSDEEKELFGRFAHNRKTKEQIIHALDTMNMDSYNGNVIVTGEDGAGTLDLAKGLVRMMQMTDRNFSGKVAKISGKTFNKKDVEGTLAKLADGALIIEHAFQMSSETAGDLNGALEKEGRGLFVVMEGGKDEMNIFLRKNAALMDNFDARIDVESLDDHSLVEYAKQYAEEQEYSIDELGILALHTRIADMQTSDHEVTVAEVKDLVDDAIYFADKKNPKHFFRRNHYS